MSVRRRALSTGQAAKHCFVTADTIANWIRSGLLRAQRTAGGQYRILVQDLRTFMATRGMSTDALEEHGDRRRPCWEFRAAESPNDANCGECIVRYLKVLDCFKLMGMRPADGRPIHDCLSCPYFRLHGTPSAESEAM
jgi:excisionase family DNA binding protein